KISMIANHDGIFKVRNQLQPIFNELRSDVLAAGRDDEILLAICNLEETIRIEFTDIAGVVPPSCESFGRFRLHVVITGHNIGPANENLAVIGNADFLPSNDRSNSSEAHSAGPVE